jgi:hypothetical protein
MRKRDLHSNVSSQRASLLWFNRPLFLLYPPLCQLHQKLYHPHPRIPRHNVRKSSLFYLDYCQCPSWGLSGLIELAFIVCRLRQLLAR